MNPVSLAEIGFNSRSHASVLWWLGLLYRRPPSFREALEHLSPTRQLTTVLWFLLHTIPYALFLSGADSIIGRLSTPPRFLAPTTDSHIYIAAEWVGFNTAYGLVTGLAAAMATLLGASLLANMRSGLARSLSFGLVAWLLTQIPIRILFHSGPLFLAQVVSWIVGEPIGDGLFFALVDLGRVFEIVLPVGLAGLLVIEINRPLSRSVSWLSLWVAFGVGLSLYHFQLTFDYSYQDAFLFSGLVASGVVIWSSFGAIGRSISGLVLGLLCAMLGVRLFAIYGDEELFFVGLALGVPFFLLRLYYNVVHVVLTGVSSRNAWYNKHPVAWDDCCGFPFPRMESLLVSYAERSPDLGRQEIERLIETYPSQRSSALKAQAMLLARQAGGTSDLARLDEVVAGLPEGKAGFLCETRRLREMVHGVAALQTRLDALERPFLREPLAQLLCREIEDFRRRIGGFQQPLSREFRAAADRWLELAREQLEASRAVLEKAPTLQVFRAGDPVDREGEAFVPRDTVVGEIERQVMLAAGCPGLVLYGRRRMGKSTVLRNLDAFLPPSVHRAGLSMQDPRASGSLELLIERLAAEIGSAADGLPVREGEDDLVFLFGCLETADRQLKEAGRRLLLSIDEYETLDQGIGEGRFPEQFLATLRESIQNHRQITWIFAGSHEITELPNAEWASYLVSARTVEVGPFTAAETRLLLTEPLKHSELWPKGDPGRPRFEPGFWGEGGIERIHAEAGGWPHLVQLIAETTVDLLNDDRRKRVDEEILEWALDKAIVRGHTVFHQLMRGESTLPGEWEYLAAFRSREAQPLPGDEAVARSLRHRLLVAEGDGEWRLRVPLMSRWLRQRG